MSAGGKAAPGGPPSLGENTQLHAGGRNWEDWIRSSEPGAFLVALNPFD
jgi:hypothetical protein